MRQTPKRLRNPRGRPQIGQRLWARTLNFGVRNAFNRIDFFANGSSFASPRPARAGEAAHQFRNGIPSSRSSSRPSSSVRALVTMQTFIPLILSILS